MEVIGCASLVCDIATDWFERLLDSIVLRVRYVSSYKDFLNELKQEVEYLNIVQERVIHRVEEGRRDGEVIEEEVARWLNRIDEVLQDADQLFKDPRKANAVCSPWSFSNLTRRYQRSRKAWRLALHLHYLSAVVKGGFDHVTYRHSEELESRKLMKGKILSALRDPNVTKVGIYGLAGVGKTLLAQHIAQLVKGDMFNVVCMTAVSQTLDVDRIQPSIVNIAAQLHERIKKEETMLIILDDVRQKLDLQRLRIRLAQGCKLLLISRNLHILHKNETQQNFKLEVLDDAESWSLFQIGAGDILKDANLQNIAKQLAQRCAGLPLVIVTMAASLQGKGVSYWKEALRILNENDYEKMADTIYSSLELSYNQLDDDEVKQVFLLCGVHGPSISIGDLLKYVIGLGAFKHVNSIDDARSKLHRIIVDLEEASSPLLRYKAGEVEVHALLCNVASLVASRHHNVFTRNALLQDWPEVNFLAGCTQITLKRCNIQKLPKQLDCPNLCFLYLDTNDNHTFEIPPSFFKGVKNLQVLVLIGMTIPSLPASLVSLAKLKTLCLNQCCLQDLSGIGALESLEILSFFQSSIKEFPTEIGQLTHLRMLDLSSSKIKVIPPKIMSNLTKLEELYMGRSKWEVESLAKQNEHDILVELAHLTSLTALELQIHEAWIVPCIIIFEKLERYNIVVGHQWEWLDSNGTLRLLKLKLDPNIHLEQEKVKAIVKRVEDLYLEETNGFSNVLCELNGEGFPLLKKLHIQNNAKIQHIVYSRERNQTPVSFPNLEAMILDNLNNLEEICHGPLIIDSFQKLKVIKVTSCGLLEYLFPVSKFIKISQLAEIEVSECSSMKNIVLEVSGTTIDETESIEGHDINDVSLGGLLPELRQLRLRNLDSFTSIVDLNNIHGRILKFNMLNHLTVYGCNELKYLLPLYVLKDMQQLKTIDISKCDQLEQVFMDHEQDTQMTNSNVMEEALPFLHSLKFSNLPQLASICSGDVQFISRSLTQMTVENCPKFIFTFAYNSRSIEEQEPSEEKSKQVIVTPTELINLHLSNVDHLKKMCMYKDLMVSFMHLTSLQLRDCNKLEYLFSLSMAQNLSSLQELKIRSCVRIEQIVKRETEERATTVEFYHMETLVLEKLPKFTGSYGQDGSSVKWLALAMVTVDECPVIQRLMLGTVDRPLLNNVFVSNCSPWQHEHRENNIVYLFDLTDELSKLENLKITDSKQLKKYMEMNLQQSSFRQLKILEASQCDNELNKFLSILLDRSNDLEQLTIQRCEQLEQVFNLEQLEQVFNLAEPVADEKQRNMNLKFPKLKTMQLHYLRKLNCIWNRDPRGIFGLGNLVELEIIKCGLRKSPLSTAILKELVRLKKLKIESCEMIGQIVEDDVEIQEISFLKLKELELVSLPELIKFNSGHRNFIFPKLLRLTIENCPKLNVLSNPTQTINEGTSDHVPLNETGCAFPKLQKLKLARLEMLEDISQGEYSRIPLCELKDVEVDFFSRLTYMWMARSEKLETVMVRNCSSLRRLILPSNCSTLREIKISDCNVLEEICTDPEQGKTDKNTFRNLEFVVLENLPMLSFFSLWTCEFSSLQKLRIVNCPTLKTFPRNVSAKADNSLSEHSTSLVLFNYIKEDPPAGEGKTKILPDIKSLELADLPNMQLWKHEPKIPLFKNLTLLRIMRCKSILKLFSISVAEHLSSLKLLTLYGCKNMAQVLEGRGGNSKPAVFQKLETLVLKHLPILTSFCEEDVDFVEFPELTMVIVEHVPNMYKFVKRALNTPKLKQVHVTYITKCWEGNLNDTIEFLHKNHVQLKDNVWESDESSTRHHSDTAESSSQGESRFKEAAETELHEGMLTMES